MSDEVQPARDKKREATRPRWTGRTRDPERFRARVIMHLRQQTGFRTRGVDPSWRQNAWEAWHILRHYYTGTVYCHECAPFIRTSLFPATTNAESEARAND